MNDSGKELYKRIKTLLLFRETDEVVAIGEPAVPALIDALKDKNEDVRYGAAIALGKIGDARAVPALIDSLNDKGWIVREGAAKVLGRIGFDKIPIEGKALA
ncbi:MAG: HEAT repeat domain-containing protein, partial [Candidatus Bilamarchaeaceae archaeon]